MPLLTATSAFRLGKDAGVLNSVVYTVSIPYYDAEMQHTTHTHTPIYRPFVRDYPGKLVPESKTSLDFTEARDNEWQWHQLGHMQVCMSLQTDNHASTPPLNFLQAGCPSCHTQK